MTWPNGIKRYVGKFASKGEAGQWIKQNSWLTAKKIDEKDLVRRGRPSSGKKSQAE
jgi:hypothetical protein